MRAWQLQEAKSRFSELVALTLREGPQLVTRRGKEAVVILAATDYRRLSRLAPTLMDCLLHAPRGHAPNLERLAAGIRDLVL